MTKLTEDLESLAKLHREGALTPEEFSQAKKKLLSAGSPVDSFPRNDLREIERLGNAANRYVTLQIVSYVVGGIIFLIILFNVVLPQANGPVFQVTGVLPR